VEDNSNTSNQKVKYNLSFKLNDQLVNLESIHNRLNPYVNIKTDDYQYELLNSPNSLELRSDLNSFYFTDVEELILAIPFLLEQIKKYDFKDVEKSIQRIDKTKLKQSTSSTYISKLSELLVSTNSLVEFMQSLFKFKSLKSFQTIHLFVHEKGQVNTVHYEIEKSNSRKYSHSISDFSSLFQSIRKSKNRTYGQTSIKGFDLDIIGTFLAHEFPLSNHNIILIISRNDFLPQTDTEVENFSILTKVLSSFIEIKLHHSLVINKLKFLKSAILESPFDIYTNDKHLEEISNSKNNIQSEKHLFSNQSYFQISKSENSILDHGDIFHHERVSLLGELLNTLRHELSNPIFGLQLTTQLLLMEDHNSEQEEFLNEVLLSIKRSQSILENFTNLYKDSTSSEAVDIIKLINEVFTLTKSESRHLKKEIFCSTEKLMFNTNPTWFAQIIFNLVINSAQASKDTPKANLKVSLELSKGFLIINFEDNGPGISDEVTGEAFKAFYTTKDKGTGLGLAICKSLTSKLKGSIQYLNNDKGAHFLLKLPYENSSN
jgi:two-component system NtrC family sensor kinase